MPASTTDLLQKGLALHRRGAVAEAAAIYTDVQRADPHNADAPYYLATIFCQQGRFAEGASLARAALANDPRHARAHVLLGRALAALDQNDEALASFDRALALAPELAQAHSHRADVLAELGRNAEAIEAYDRALAAAPDAVEDWFNRGAALAAVGRQHDAILSFDRVIAARPVYAPAYLLRAKALSDLRRYDEALAAADRALAIEPGLAEAWLGRGHVLAALRRHQEALAAYDKSLELNQDFDQAWLGRGSVLIATGRPDLALAAARRALELKETSQSKILFAHTLKLAGAPDAANIGQIHEQVLRALSQAWIRPRDLVGVCIDLVKRDGAVSDAIARANAAWPQRLTSAEWGGPLGIAALANNALLCRLLECAPVTDVGLERLLTNVRHMLLTSAADSAASDAPLLHFGCALARQCFINGYVFALTEAESEQAKRLQAALEQALHSGEQCSPLWPAVVGSYISLNALSKAAALLDRSWPTSVAAVIVQQVKEPAEERQLAAAIPRLTKIDGEVSRAVRQQYEENPYPRWPAAGPPARPAILDICEPEQIRDVLIAGCGTGLVTLEFARQAPQARFLAIDLSRASIGYAKRMAQTLGVTNVEFAQADIVELGSLTRDFDVIETSGVLHHLADPWAGWTILLSLLRPSGVMQVGLYSELARQNIVAARALIAKRGYRPIAEDIRSCRQEIMAANDALLKSLVNVADFFTADDCRDLLFHVQERRMTLPEIKSFVAANDLEFIGFVLDAATRQLFTARFPNPAALTDLDCWHAFETGRSQTFAGMYQFGVRKRATQSV